MDVLTFTVLPMLVRHTYNAFLPQWLRMVSVSELTAVFKSIVALDWAATMLFDPTIMSPNSQARVYSSLLTREGSVHAVACVTLPRIATRIR